MTSQCHSASRPDVKYTIVTAVGNAYAFVGGPFVGGPVVGGPFVGGHHWIGRCGLPRHLDTLNPKP
jgi:hypothetical protein